MNALLVFVVALTAISADGSDSATKDSSAWIQVGEKAPALTATWLNIDGNAQEILSYDGRLTLVDFWATWCVSCVRSVPKLNELQREYAGSGLKILFLSDEDPDVYFKDIVKGIKANFSIGAGSNSKKDFGASSVPAMFLVAEDGTVLWTGRYPDQQDKQGRDLHTVLRLVRNKAPEN